MTDQIDSGLRRADREIEAARSLIRERFAAQAISRAYYACFYAAEMALLAIGESRSKHSGVVSAFSRLVVKEGGLDPGMGRVLRRRFEDRNEADYEFVEPPPSEVEEAIEDADRFVAAVRDWLEHR